MPNYIIAALYHFAPLQADEALKLRLKSVCDEAGICGTLLIASEGINGTIAGTREGLDAVLAWIRAMPGFEALEHKESWSEGKPFLRMKVRLKKEIVTMGVPGTDPNKIVGTYVEPEDWNALISQPDVITIDTRNDYEVRIGRFKGAVDPQTMAFREFPDWFRRFKATRPNARIAMYCTGGIRCEKSTAFAKEEGLDEVYHLKGGILKYLEDVPEEDSLWEGECYVFDGRIAVKHGLVPGDHSMCPACGSPLDEDDCKTVYYKVGVSCPYCHPESPARNA